MATNVIKDFGQNNPKISRYVSELFHPEDELLVKIKENSLKYDLPQIHVGEMDGLHLEVLVRAMGATKGVEIGTLAGYSALHLIRGMGEQGKLFTFEFDPHHGKVAEENFKLAGIDKQIELFVGPALDQLPNVEQHGPFDFVFIDADKVNYPHYFAWAKKNLRVGGVIFGDNTFAWGTIAQETFHDKISQDVATALRTFNEYAAKDPDFRGTILPTAEGLTMAVKIR